MERNLDVTIENGEQEQGNSQCATGRERLQAAELRERFGITSPELVARALRISQARALELLEFGT